MNLNFPTVHERILTMTFLELEQLAESESLGIADSSRLEGLVLDQEQIRNELSIGYQLIQSKSKMPT